MKKLVEQIFKFGIVGVIAFTVDYIIFSILVFIRVHYLIAQIISFSVSLIINYLLSIKYVFNVEDKSFKKIMLFIILSVIGLLYNELYLYVGVSKCGINEFLMKLIATGLVMVFNFISRKIVVEKNKLSRLKKIIFILLVIVFFIAITGCLFILRRGV